MILMRNMRIKISEKKKNKRKKKYVLCYKEEIFQFQKANLNNIFLKIILQIKQFKCMKTPTFLKHPYSQLHFQIPQQIQKTQNLLIPKMKKMKKMKNLKPKKKTFQRKHNIQTNNLKPYL